jgi:hypothetical protein
MVSVRRWAVVAVGVGVLVALPATIAALPVRQSSTTAADLLARIKGSTSVPYSGYAESFGGLSLPVTRQFSTVADLFGQTTQLRAWYRGGADWRVDSITLAGESDVHAGPSGTWTWDYENNRATWTGGTVTPAVRLPAAGDLLPTNLGRRLLSEATAAEVRRIATKRIAGHTAPGLRLTPHASGSTIERVDVWADERTGLPLRVDVYGSGTTVVSSRFLEFSTHQPSPHDTAFVPPAGADVRSEDQFDIAAQIDQVGESSPPPTLAGLPRNPSLASFGAVGVYGSGVTELVAVPLPGRVQGSLQRQLGDTATRTDVGLTLTVGPLGLFVTNPDSSGVAWLLTGTLTPDTLTKAATQLVGR